jgi:hypothetical protein
MTHTYRPLRRPASMVTLPTGLSWEFVQAPWDLAHIRTDIPRGDTRFGLIATTRPLTADECEAFELKYERFA